MSALFLPTVLPLFLALPQAPVGQAETAPADDVRLIVLVSVDQMIPEQLDRLSPLFSGGLARFAEGEVWRTAAHGHGVTETGPGHATLGSGVHPRSHGLISNDWLAPDNKDRLYCVADPDVQLVGPGGPFSSPRQQRSPRNLRAPGLGDHLEAQVPEGKSVSIAAKDRAAIGTNGRAGDLVLWWDQTGRGFITSEAYADSLPDFVKRWDANWTGILDAGQGSYFWKSQVPAEATLHGTMPDLRPGEANLEDGTVFPHLAPGVTQDGFPSEIARLAKWMYFTPNVDTFSVEIAKRAVRELQLGMDEHVDTLFVGLSACDTAGHLFGPYSQEVTDVLLNADRQLETLFKLLDERVGEGRWIAALSADHGVLPLPEYRVTQGQEGERVSGSDVGEALKALRLALTERYSADVMVGGHRNRLRLSAKAMTAGGFDPVEVRAFAAEFMRVEVPSLARVFTVDELLAIPADAALGLDPIATLMARSTLKGRSPDVIWLRPSGTIDMRLGTTHGSPYGYDRNVPLAFIGVGSTPGHRWDKAWTVDVLPTLFMRAGLKVPAGLDGKVLK